MSVYDNTRDPLWAAWLRYIATRVAIEVVRSKHSGLGVLAMPIIRC